jgi:hypothetical protein
VTVADRTPSLAEYLPRHRSDRNAWWRLEPGDRLNLFDEAADRLDDARATIARVDAAHQPERRSGWWACISIYCEGWPCHVHIALHDETEDTCTHAGEPAAPQDFGDVDNGFGGLWPRCSETCDLHVVRPGKVQCRCGEGR